MRRINLSEIYTVDSELVLMLLIHLNEINHINLLY